MIFAPFPVVEVAKDRNAFGFGGPLTIHKLVSFAVDAISFVALRDVIEAMLGMEVRNPLINEIAYIMEISLSGCACT